MAEGDLDRPAYARWIEFHICVRACVVRVSTCVNTIMGSFVVCVCVCGFNYAYISIRFIFSSYFHWIPFVSVSQSAPRVFVATCGNCTRLSTCVIDVYVCVESVEERYMYLLFRIAGVNWLRRRRLCSCADNTHMCLFVSV